MEGRVILILYKLQIENNYYFIDYHIEKNQKKAPKSPTIGNFSEDMFAQWNFIQAVKVIIRKIM